MIKTQYNAITNTTIEVAFDEDDFAQLAKDQKAEALQLLHLEQKAQAKEAALGKLADLGLTLDDLQALGL